MTDHLNNNHYFLGKEGLIPNFFTQVTHNFQKFSWVRRLFETFTPIEHQQTKGLSGRIQELHEDAHEIKKQLESIKQELNEELDQDLRPLIKEVLDPLLRELDKQQVLHEEETVRKYSTWTENAQKWVHIYLKKKDKTEIVQALAKHVIQKSFDRIDRDLQCILEYIEQHVNGSNKPSHEKKAAKNRLIKEISPYMIRLTSLKLSPEADSLVEISKWKEFVDSQRQELFHTILQVIETQ